MNELYSYHGYEATNDLLQYYLLKEMDFRLKLAIHNIEKDNVKKTQYVVGMEIENIGIVLSKDQLRDIYKMIELQNVYLNFLEDRSDDYRSSLEKYITSAEATEEDPDPDFYKVKEKWFFDLFMQRRKDFWNEKYKVEYNEEMD
jgi:hypothetical protein